MASVSSGNGEILADAARALAVRLGRPGSASSDRLGEIFLVCSQVAQDEPSGFQDARRDGALPEFLLPRVRARLREERGDAPRGGWLGTFVGADGRAIEAEEGRGLDPAKLDLSARALQLARSRARAQQQDTQLRNLRWYEERLGHRSYASIARAEGKPVATVRTGVARARKHVLRMVHELQHAQPAPLNGDAPPEIEPLRQLWVEQKLDQLEEGLERTRAQHRDDPHWLNLAALLQADRGERERARELYERALIFADAAGVRGRVLNNLGNLSDDLARPDDAHHYWLRARQLLPEAPAPLVNLLVAAAVRRDYPSAQHHLAEIGELLSSGRLTREDRQYVLRRLIESPKLAWLRDTDAWRVGPERWTRAGRTRSGWVATGAALLLSLLLPVLAQADTSPATSAARDLPLPGSLESNSGRGGDSMGSPPRGRGRRAPSLEGLLQAGDSMGWTRRPGKKRRRSVDVWLGSDG